MLKVTKIDKEKKTEEVLLYLLKGSSKSSITSLMKLSYLVDLIAAKRLKKQISGFKYKRYQYGPFDKKIHQYIEKFEEKNLVKSQSDYGLTGGEFNVFYINPEKEADLSFKNLNDDEKKILDELLASVRGYGAKMITEMSYKTKPMKRLKTTVDEDKYLGKKLNLAA